MPADQAPDADPAFRAAVAEIETAVAEQRTLRPEITFAGEAPPRRLAPHAAAVGATGEVSGREIGSGRFVLLYDPAGQDAGAGPFRVIAYIRAHHNPAIPAPPLYRQFRQ